MEDLRTNEQKQFAYKTLVAATQDFDPKFKLGQGGFGAVFKVSGVPTICLIKLLNEMGLGF